MSTLARLAEVSEENWYQHYPAIRFLIADYIATVYQRQGHEQEKTLLMAFLTKAQAHLPHLLRSSKYLLFNILSEWLPVHATDHTLERLTVVLNLLLRTHFENESRLLAIVDRYALQLQAFKDWPADTRVQQTVWNILGMYERYATNETSFSASVMTLMFSFRHWGNTDLSWHQVTLYVWRTCRPRQLGGSLDTSVKRYIELVLEELPHESLRKQFREMVYIDYVRYLTDPSSFKNFYTTVSRETVLPFTDSVTLGNKVTVIMKTQEVISEPVKKRITDTLNEAVFNMALFKTAMEMPVDRVDLTQGNVTLYLFHNQTDYARLSKLWGVRTDNGGFMQVNVTRSGPQFQVFVFRYVDETFRNLGHEFVHVLTFAWLGRRQALKPPLWLIEGMATALGNPDCHGETLRYLKASNTTFTVDNICQLHMADGLDLYHYGSVLFKYLYQSHPSSFSFLMKLVRRNRTNSEQFNAKVRAFSPNHFQSWLTDYQGNCVRYHRLQQTMWLHQLKEAIQAGRATDLMRRRMDWLTVDINARFEHQNTLMHLAIQAGDLKSVWEFLHRGANLIAVNDQNETPRSLAADHRTIQAYVNDFLGISRRMDSTTEKENLTSFLSETRMWVTQWTKSPISTTLTTKVDVFSHTSSAITSNVPAISGDHPMTLILLLPVFLLFILLYVVCSKNVCSPSHYQKPQVVKEKEVK